MSELEKKDLWDFSLRFITPTVRRYLPEPGSGLALELGCGSGRWIRSASTFFGQVKGIDSPEIIDAVLPVAGRPDNVDLLVRKSDRLPVDSDSIDFVFSMTGLTQFETLARFGKEISEVQRVLKPGGLAMLWFGRITRMPFVVNPATWLRGYSYRADDKIALRVRQTVVRRSLRKAGLRHVALSTPLHPDTSWRLFRGGDLSYVTAVKSS